MPDTSAILGSLAIALLLVVMLGFAFGTQRNIRRGNARLAWLQPALPPLARRTTLGWLGSSVVRLELVDPHEPFREVSVLYVLEPRDIPLLWLFARAGGRRDVLIFRANLRRAPRMEMEAIAPRAWVKAADEDEVAAWPRTEFVDGVRATVEPGADPALVGLARRAWERLAAGCDEVWRISIRRTVPHLEVHVRPPADQAADPSRLVGAIRELAQELTRT